MLGRCFLAGLGDKLTGVVVADEGPISPPKIAIMLVVVCGVGPVALPIVRDAVGPVDLVGGAVVIRADGSIAIELEPSPYSGESQGQVQVKSKKDFLARQPPTSRQL